MQTLTCNILVKSPTLKPDHIGSKTDAKAEVPVLWPPDAKNQLIGKYPDARKH